MSKFLRSIFHASLSVWIFGVLAFCSYALLLALVGLQDTGVGPKLLLSGAGGICVVLAILCHDQRQ